MFSGASPIRPLALVFITLPKCSPETKRTEQDWRIPALSLTGKWRNLSFSVPRRFFCRKITYLFAYTLLLAQRSGRGLRWKPKRQMPAAYALPQARKGAPSVSPGACGPADQGEPQSKPIAETTSAPPLSLSNSSQPCPRLGYKITLRRSCLNTSQPTSGDYRFGVGIKFARAGIKTDGPFVIVGFHDGVSREVMGVSVTTN